jgi:hypothetical protein
MKLPKIVFKALKTTKTLSTYACFWVVITGIEMIQQTMMAHLLTDQDLNISYKTTIAIIILATKVVRFGIFGECLSNISAVIKISIWRDTLIEYNGLTLESKNVFSTRDLERKMNDASWGFSFWIDNGFPTIMNLVSMSYLCIYTFYLSGTIYLLISLTAGIIALYFGFKRDLDNKMADVWEKNRAEREKYHNY